MPERPTPCTAGSRLWAYATPEDSPSLHIPLDTPTPSGYPLTRAVVRRDITHRSILLCVSLDVTTAVSTPR